MTGASTGAWRNWLITACLVTTSAGAETLQEAWNIALTMDHGFQAVKEMTAAAAQQVQAAEAARLPALELGAGYIARDNAPGATTNVDGNPVEFPTGEKNNQFYNATVTLPLYTSGLVSNRIDSAKASLEAAQMDELSRLLDLKLRIAEAFVSALRTESGLEVAESHVTSLKAHVRDVQNRYEQGVVAQNDLLAAQVELADARQIALQAANQLDLAHAGYNRLLGRPLAQPVSLQNLSPKPASKTLETLETLALTQRSELSSLTQQIQALRRQVKGIRAETGPQIALNGGYDFRENQFLAHEGVWSVTLGLQWSVFDGGVIRHQARATTRQAIALQHQYEDMVSIIKLEVRQAWLEAQETRKRIVVTESAIAQAEENLTVNRDRYENGLSTNTEVLDAETLRTRSRNNHANANYDAALAILHLRRAVGEL